MAGRDNARTPEIRAEGRHAVRDLGGQAASPDPGPGPARFRHAMRIVAGMDEAGYGLLLGPSPRRLHLKLKARRAPATTHMPPSAGALGGVECGRRPRPALALLKARCVGNVLRAPGGTLVADEVRP